MRHQYHPEAFAELGAAEAWYEEELPGLGMELQEAVEDAIFHVKAAPGASPRWPLVAAPAEVRRRTICRFPYAIAYFVHDNTVMIIAVAHTSRRPGYWVDRLR